MIAAIAIPNIFAELARRLMAVRAPSDAPIRLEAAAPIAHTAEAMAAFAAYGEALDERTRRQALVRAAFEASRVAAPDLRALNALIKNGHATADAMDEASRCCAKVVRAGFHASRLFATSSRELSLELAEMAQGIVWTIQEYADLARDTRAAVETAKQVRYEVTSEYLLTTSQHHYDALAKM